MSRRHRAKGKVAPSYIGLTWFDHSQWQRLTDVAADRSELDETSEAWEKVALNAVIMIERQGITVEKVLINVEELLAWCRCLASGIRRVCHAAARKAHRTLDRGPHV